MLHNIVKNVITEIKFTRNVNFDKYQYTNARENAKIAEAELHKEDINYGFRAIYEIHSPDETSLQIDFGAMPLNNPLKKLTHLTQQKANIERQYRTDIETGRGELIEIFSAINSFLKRFVQDIVKENPDAILSAFIIDPSKTFDEKMSNQYGTQTMRGKIFTRMFQNILKQHGIDYKTKETEDFIFFKFSEPYHLNQFLR